MGEDLLHTGVQQSLTHVPGTGEAARAAITSHTSTTDFTVRVAVRQIVEVSAVTIGWC